MANCGEGGLGASQHIVGVWVYLGAVCEVCVRCVKERNRGMAADRRGRTKRLCCFGQDFFVPPIYQITAT